MGLLSREGIQMEVESNLEDKKKASQIKKWLFLNFLFDNLKQK